MATACLLGSPADCRPVSSRTGTYWLGGGRWLGFGGGCQPVGNLPDLEVVACMPRSARNYERFWRVPTTVCESAFSASHREGKSPARRITAFTDCQLCATQVCVRLRCLVSRRPMVFSPFYRRALFVTRRFPMRSPRGTAWLSATSGSKVLCYSRF